MWGTGILKGMWVTIKNMFRGPITVQYPEQRVVLPERSRWAVAPKFDEEGKPKCTACTNCVKACPDHILDLQFHANEDKSKHIDSFTYEIGACMFCGLCVEACPFDALCMSKEYELAVRDVDDFTTTLLEDVPAAGPKRAKAAAEDHKKHEPQREGREETGSAPGSGEVPPTVVPETGKDRTPQQAEMAAEAMKPSTAETTGDPNVPEAHEAAELREAAESKEAADG